MKPIMQLDPASYERHAIHGEGRCWAETNCYVDVLVELIHALGYDPVAALAYTICIDFEVDQWTFFKYSHRDLLNMFGMEIQELNPWVSLSQHVEEQVNAGRPILVELDSYFLPDTAGTAYKTAHVKSTVAVNEIDTAAGHMGYFHGQGYYHVGGDDFRDLFQLNGLVHDRMLPPYIELVKLRKQPGDVSDAKLLQLSLASLQRQLRLLPDSNPFGLFKVRFTTDLDWLRQEPIKTFHNYSFATLRQYGACFELAETYLTWLQDRSVTGIADSIACFRDISETAKIFQFKLARALARDKELDLTPIDHMGELWQKGVDPLTRQYLG